MRPTSIREGTPGLGCGTRCLRPLRQARVPGRVAILVLAWLAGPVLGATSFEDARGSFRPAVRHAVGANPFAVAQGDFNGDGKVDLAVGNQDGDSVSILLGAGAGTFAPAVAYAVGDGAQTVAVADFNGDSRPDLAVANLWSHDVSVLLGTGTGTFSPSVAYAVGTNPRSVAVGDFNADGSKDLVVPNGSSGNVSVLLGVGNGTFGSAVPFQVGGGAIAVAIGDFNGDARSDLAVANQQSNSVSILLGTGTGSFGTRTDIAVGADPTSVASGDFNADGKLDLAVANLEGGNVSVLLGTGSGTFNAASPVAAGPRPVFVAAADLTGDGRPELAVANEAGHSVSILLGSASGAFGTATHVPTTGQFPRSLAIGDVDNDGRPDLVVVHPPGGDVAVLLGESLPVLSVKPIGNIDGNGSYALRKSTLWIDRQVPPGWPFAHAAYADFNRDGRVDFVRTFSDNTDTRRPVQFMRNDGGGAFSDQTAAWLSNAQPGVIVPRKILTGDFNGDGWPDVFVLNHGLDVVPAPGEHPQLFLSNGNGTLRYVPGLEAYVDFNHGGASADIDGNGTLDVLVVNPVRPYLLLNDGQGRLTRNWNRLSTDLIGNVTYTAELVDIDQDGYVDILGGGGEDATSRTTIYWGDASGYYRASRKTTLPMLAGWTIVLDFAVEDIDGDGLRDLIVNRAGSDPVYVGRRFQVLRQTAPRVFADESAARISMDTSQEWIDFIRVQDIDGDGDPDIFVDDRNFVSRGDFAWINNGAGVFAPFAGLASAVTPAPALAITDVSVSEGNSGSRQLDFTVALTSVGPAAVTYDIATVNHTAVSGSDYVARSLVGQSIPAGQARNTFSVAITGDSAYEADETFFVTLANVAGATVTNGTAAGTIANDDGPTLSILDASVVEGGAGTRNLVFTVKLSAAVGTPVTFDAASADGTAASGSDYAALALSGQTIPAGATTRTLSVAINGDASVEANETVIVNLGNVGGPVHVTDASAVGTILNDDGPVLTVGDVAITEGNAGTRYALFKVGLSQAVGAPVTFNFATAQASATAGSDYGVRNLTGLAIAAGATTRTISVAIAGDASIEANETFNVLVSGVSGPVTVLDDRAVGTIVNDDGPTLSIADVKVVEGNAGTRTPVFTVALSQAAVVPVTFDIGTAPGTATAGSDYTTKVLAAQTIPAGQTTYAFTVSVAGDATIEPNETLFVNLANASGATLADAQAVGTIINDEGPLLTIGDVAVSEGDSGTRYATFTLTLSQAAATPVTYGLLTVNSTAVGGNDASTDFQQVNVGGLSIAAGMLARTANVRIFPDTSAEGDEKFVLILTDVAGGATVYDDRAVGTILNDD